MALSGSRDRLAALETLVEKADELFLKAALDDCEVNVSYLFSYLFTSRMQYFYDIAH